MTLRVDEVVLRELRIPLRRPFRTSRVVTTERRICLLDFRLGGTTIAWSECVAGERPDYTAETIDTAWHALTSLLLPVVVGHGFDSPARVEVAMDGVRGHRMAKAAVEMGFHVIVANAEGTSLSAHLGGERERVAAGASIGMDEDTGALAKRAAEAAELGYGRVKVKIAPGRDHEPLRRVRAAIGPGVTLTADANGSYAAARREFDWLDDVGLQLLEQPFAPEDLTGHAALQAAVETPICLDESIETPEHVSAMLALGAGRIVNIKPGRVGGLGPAVRIHDRCHGEGVPVMCGGMLETGIGRAYNLALAALPGFTVTGDLYPPSSYLETDVVHRPAELESGGWLAVPDGGGLGVDVDQDLVEELTVRSHRIAAP